MSNVKSKKTHPAVKRQQQTSEKSNNNVYKKNKFWFKDKVKMKKFPPNNQRKVEPPKDAQHFSTNWKALQEILKASEPEKKQPVTSTTQPGSLQKKEAKENSSINISKKNTSPKQAETGKKGKPKTAKENSSINISKKNTSPKQAETGKKGKQKTGSGIVVSKDAHVKAKVPAVSPSQNSVAPKRKSSSGNSSSEHMLKKKKVVVAEKKPTEDDLWFDDVDPDDIEATVGSEAADIMRKKLHIYTKDAESALVKEKAFEGLTKAVAIDCEMVGVGPEGEDSILARASLVNQFGKCIYDKYVKPTERVTDYRTAVSGIRPEDIKDGEDVKVVQREVAEILRGRIVVGHAIHNDLKILLLDHPKKKIRDTQKYKPFKKIAKSGRPSLKVLCKEVLNVKVQQGEHSSVQDAQATMRLYTMEKKQWEAEIKASHQNKDSDQKSEKRKPKLPKSR